MFGGSRERLSGWLFGCSSAGVVLLVGPACCCCDSSLIGEIASVVSPAEATPPPTTSSSSSSTLLVRRCCRLLFFLFRLAMRVLPAEEELAKPSRAEDRRRDESRAFSSSTRARVPPSIHGRYTRARLPGKTRLLKRTIVVSRSKRNVRIESRRYESYRTTRARSRSRRATRLLARERCRAEPRSPSPRLARFQLRLRSRSSLRSAPLGPARPDSASPRLASLRAPPLVTARYRSSPLATCASSPCRFTDIHLQSFLSRANVFSQQPHLAGTTARERKNRRRLLHLVIFASLSASR